MKRNILAVLAVSAMTFGLAACNENLGNSSNTGSSDSAIASNDSSSSNTDFDATKGISTYNRDTTSGTRDGFFTKIGAEDAKSNDTLLASGFVTVTSNGDMMAKVAADEYGIGYSSLADLTNSVKALSVNGVVASNETVKDGTYTLQRNFNYVHKALDLTKVHDALIQSYVSFAFSTEGIAIIEGDGGILEDTALQNSKPWAQVIADASNATWVNTLGLTATGATNTAIASETINFTGSTSVEPISTALSSAWSSVFGANKPTVNHNHTGSGAAFTTLADGTGDIGFASRDFNESETGSHPDYVTGRICRDAICPIVNTANPLDDITVTELRGIFINARAFTDAAWAEENFGTTFEGESAITEWSALID